MNTNISQGGGTETASQASISLKGFPFPITELPKDDLIIIIVIFIVVAFTLLRVFKPTSIVYQTTRSILLTDSLLFLKMSGVKNHNGDICFTMNTLLNTEVPNAANNNQIIMKEYCCFINNKWKFKLAEWFRGTFLFYVAAVILCLVLINNSQLYKWPLLAAGIYLAISLYCLFAAEKIDKSIRDHKAISHSIKERSDFCFQAK